MTETGQRYARITVLSFSRKDEQHRKYWHVRCECGKEWECRGDGLTSGRVKSCGCLGKEIRLQKNTTHGLCPRGPRSPEYTTWASMLRRCENPNSKAYCHYGARGIKVCKRWHDFATFFADMGQRPDGMSLERVDNNRGYEPSNCIWATHQTQMRNTRQTGRVIYQGKRMCATEACQRAGISRHRIYFFVHKYRITHQAAFERALAMDAAA